MCYDIRVHLGNVRNFLELLKDQKTSRRSAKYALDKALHHTYAAMKEAKDLFEELFTAKCKRALQREYMRQAKQVRRKRNNLK